MKKQRLCPAFDFLYFLLLREDGQVTEPSSDAIEEEKSDLPIFFSKEEIEED